MTKLFLDLETYSETPITHGTHRYAEKAEVLLVALAFDDEPVCVWDMTDGTRALGQLQMAIDTADEVVIHNSAFDRTVLRHCGVHIPVEKIHDTMVRALMHSLPGSLGALCDVLGVPQDKAKDKTGKKLIQLFTKPRPKNMKLRRATRDTHPDEWGAFVEYARLDVDAMRDVYGRLPNWNYSLSERDLWRIDQRVNDRGIAVDVELARAAIRAFERTSRSLALRAGVLTGGSVTSTTQRAKLLEHLETAHGFVAPDLTKGSVSAFLSADLDPEVRELLEIRQQAAATSPAKYKVLINATSSDGRLRGTIQFCGASRTGRDAGRIFQPQNLPRPTLKGDVIEAGIKAMKLDCEDLLFENVSELCASAVRGCLVAEPGNKLVVADLSNIEGRMLAWVANERWKLDAFADFDKGIGHDLYKVAYAKAFNIPAEEVTKAQRQIGKVMELAFGYGGGVGAWVTFAAAFGIDLEKLAESAYDTIPDNAREEATDFYRHTLATEGNTFDLSERAFVVCDAFKRLWRWSHPAVSSLWYDLERACKDAIAEPGAAFTVQDLTVGFRDNWLRIKLPSKRFLCYPNARNEKGQLMYDGVHQLTRKWTALKTYSGKLVENVVQAASRDVFMLGMKRAEEAGYAVCVRVHDELITETPDTDDFTVAGLANLMSANPAWAVGLPLAAAGFETYRYRKDD